MNHQNIVGTFKTSTYLLYFFTGKIAAVVEECPKSNSKIKWYDGQSLNFGCIGFYYTKKFFGIIKNVMSFFFLRKQGLRQPNTLQSKVYIFIIAET